MALPIFLPGKLTAAALNGGFRSVGALAAYKAASTSRSSAGVGTTLTIDPDLQVTVVANGIYQMSCGMPFSGATAADLKLSWSGPTGATMTNWSVHYQDPGAHVNEIKSAIGTVQNIAIDATVRPLIAHGVLVVSSTAGTFGAMWAQLVADASSTTIGAGAWMVLTPISVP